MAIVTDFEPPAIKNFFKAQITSLVHKTSLVDLDRQVSFVCLNRFCEKFECSLIHAPMIADLNNTSDLMQILSVTF